MSDRGRRRLSTRNLLRVLVALLFAINVPLSVAFASMAGPAQVAGDAPSMSCHEPASGKTQDESKSDPSAASQHLCCFTACIPLAAAADAIIALALPVGEPLLILPTTRPMARAIGVDPPPPRS